VGGAEPFIGQVTLDTAWTPHQLIDTKDALFKDMG
jgi:hypothetical protein